MVSNVQRPELGQIVQRGLADLRAELAGSEPTVPLSTEYAIVVANAGASHLKHGRIDYAMRQQFPRTADLEGVSRHASVYAIPIQQPKKSSGIAVVLGSAGAAIPIGQTMVFANLDLVYVVTAAVTIPAIGQVKVFIEAVNTGAAANLADKTILTLESPPAGVESEAIVLTLTGGSDLENRDQLLKRVEFREQGGKLVGKPGDWEEWAREYSGVTRAWEVPMTGGPGTMGIFFVFDNDPVSIFPDVATVALVQVAVSTKAPSLATVIAYSPDNQPLDPEISITPDSPEVRTSVQLELEAMILREGTAKGFTLSISKIREAISRAPGEEANTLISPVVDQVYPVGSLPTLGTIAWS